MKEIWKQFKQRYKSIIITIIIYQVFLTIFFYSVANLRILGFLIVVLAIAVLVETYIEPIKNKFKIKE